MQFVHRQVLSEMNFLQHTRKVDGILHSSTGGQMIPGYHPDILFFFRPKLSVESLLGYESEIQYGLRKRCTRMIYHHSGGVSKIADIGQLKIEPKFQLFG